MSNTPEGDIRATANAHMRRDLDDHAKWDCPCEACQQIRSLIGMEKVLEVRPLVREIREVEEQIQAAPENVHRQVLLERYVTLYDKLADVMARQS